MSNKNVLLVGCLLSLPAAQFAIALVYYVRSFHATTFDDLKPDLVISQVGAGIVVVAETSIALVLVYLLREAKSGFHRTNSVINRLMAYTIGTGLITGVWSLIGFIFEM